MDTFDSILTHLTQTLANDVNLDISTTSGNALWMTYAIFASILFDAKNEKEIGLNALNPVTAQRFELDGLGILLNAPRPYLYPAPLQFTVDKNLPTGLMAGTLIVMPEGFTFVLVQNYSSVTVGQVIEGYYSSALDRIPFQFVKGTSTQVINSTGETIPDFSVTLPDTVTNTLLTDGTPQQKGYRDLLQTVRAASGRGLLSSIQAALSQYPFVQSSVILLGNLSVPQTVTASQVYTLHPGEVIVILQLTVLPPTTLVDQHYPIYTQIAQTIEQKKDLLNFTPDESTYTDQITIDLPNSNPNQAPIPVSFILGNPIEITTATLFLTPFSDKVPQSGPNSLFAQIEMFLKNSINAKTLNQPLYLVELAGEVQQFINSLGLSLNITLRKVTVNNDTSEQIIPLTDQYFKISPSFSMNISYME